MVKKMLINASHPEECRVAVVSDGMLDELDVQVRTHEATLGNIYKGVICRIEPSLQAVFVEYGSPKNGFLSINDVHPSYFPDSFEGSKRRPRIQDVFKKDDHVLVQVNKEERANKGASLTTNISLAGRYLVLMPGTDLYGVSRKIENEEERKKLKEIGRQLKMPDNMGFIIRTAGMGKTKTELARDLNYLLKLWESIENNVSALEPPALLYKEHDLVIRSIREHFSTDINEILVDEREVYKRVKDFFHQVMPKHEVLVKFYQEKRPLFNKYQLEEQIECVYRRKIKLKSGGHIVIEPTEALVSIDVNSGSATKEKGVEETAFRVNMEAAPEIARQLRLRDLGGIIAIDFIDMTLKKHNQELERALKGSLKSDRAKTKVLRVSSLGVLELSRQRLKSSLGTGEYSDCPHCDGQGKIRSPETSALSIFRRVKSLILKNDVTEVRATVPAKTAEYLLNNMRAQLFELEKAHSAKISIIIRQHMPDKDVEIEALREETVEQPVQEAPTLVAEPIVAEPPAPEPAEAPVMEEPKPKRSRPKRRGKKRETPPVAELPILTETQAPPEEAELEALEGPGDLEVRFEEKRSEDLDVPEESPLAAVAAIEEEEVLSETQIVEASKLAPASEEILQAIEEDYTIEMASFDTPPWEPEPTLFDENGVSALSDESETPPPVTEEAAAEESQELNSVQGAEITEATEAAEVTDAAEATETMDLAPVEDQEGTVSVTTEPDEAPENREASGPVDSATATATEGEAETEQAAAATEQEPEAKEAEEKEKAGPRKILLQNYLPFS
jgi:ribonuclease E